MRNLNHRLKVLEALTTKCPVPSGERLVVVYEKDDQAALVNQRLITLKEKYPKASIDDLMIIRVIYD